MADMFVMEAVNLFCGDHSPDTSKFLTLTSLTLPALEQTTAEHTPGGGIGTIEFGMGVLGALQPGFNLNGYDPDLLSQFGLGDNDRKVFTAYGVIKNKRTSEEFEGKSIFHAILGTVTPDEFSRGELSGYEYALREVTHYESYFDTREKFYFDFFTNAFRVDGVSKFKNRNRILRIPGG